VTPIQVAAETRLGILTASLTVTVIRTHAVEATETETETLMAATAGIGANVAARLLRAVDATRPSTEGEEAIQEVLPEVAAPQEAVQGITMLRLPLPLLQPRTAQLMLPVGKVVLLDWHVLLSSMRIQAPGTWRQEYRRVKGKGKGNGQINQVMKSFRCGLPLQAQVSVSNFHSLP